MMKNEPVDAVITWVNGNDSAHKEKLANYFIHRGLERPKSVEPTRFDQCGEIDYCVKALLLFAPWIRTIYIVTDAQTPTIFNQLMSTSLKDKLKIIDHRAIFTDYEDQLPTFNSLSIESVLWRIPGLSNQFIYFNDDCFLIRPVTYNDFFRDGKLVLRGCWKVPTERKWAHRFRTFIDSIFHRAPRATRTSEHRIVQENSARLAGFQNRFFHLHHMPFPINKNTFADFFEANPEILAHNVSYAFRHPQQIWPISLAQHLDIHEGRVIFDPSLTSVTVNGACHSLDKIEARLANADSTKSCAFICMQSMDAAPQATQKRLFDWMKSRLDKAT